MKEKSTSAGLWVQAPENLKQHTPFLKARPLRPLGEDRIECEATTDRGLLKLQIANSSSFPMSAGDAYDDMCEMDILNEPEILNNLVQRYKRSQIFTLIGPTLIIINPYRLIPQFFSQEQMMRIRGRIIDGTTSQQKPHIYLIAGNAYTSMIDQQKKQAIVISGESGAGKTESTKYCMQLLTSLSHRESHPIEAKILACNPVLEAFGNSKTLRNDNSSRFGKYVQIFFDTDNTIAGADINSYLLQKSRVVSAAPNERSYHIFYCLLASGTLGMQGAQAYKYLSRTNCYEATGVQDKKYFGQIQSSMKSIGFQEKDMNRIWDLLCCILELGNIEFDDRVNKEDESKPCTVVNKELMEKIAKRLGVVEVELQKILLFEKKKFLKEFTLSPYNKTKSYTNVNTLSKAIYNAIFEFVLHKIQQSLRPSSKKQYNSINILDIFGFENFDVNSFEQFCINFTNEKLLKLYNQYVFEREMKILLEDGLGSELSSIKPPTNQNIIEIISGKLSLFSIINDLTMPQQFKDSDIIQSFESKLGKSDSLLFDKIHKNKFTILHSQCNVKYEIDGFKQKNQDKVLPQILEIVDGLFPNNSKEQVGKTLLSKFSLQIDGLMKELTSSNVHFIRCIKPNEKKIPNNAEEGYILSQVRYLGVFETIQIRKKTFPSRWLYQQFVERFGPLFPNLVGNPRTKTENIMKQLSKNTKQYLFGNQRVYMNSQIESKLSKKLHDMMRKKVESAKLIWKAFKNYKFKKEVFIRLKLLAKRIRLWKKLCAGFALNLQKQAMGEIKVFVQLKKEKEREMKNKSLNEAKKKREEEQRLKAGKKIEGLKKTLPDMMNRIEKVILKANNRIFMKNCQGLPAKAKKAPPANNLKPSSNLKPEIKTQPDLDESIVDDYRSAYKRNVEVKLEKKDFQFNESFIDQKSISILNRPDVVFEGLLQVPIFEPSQSKGLDRLKMILAEKFRFEFDESEEDFFSPQSDDSSFKMEDTPNDLMNKIISFNSKDFYKSHLRKRTNFIGMSKDENDILVAKPKPLSKSLTLLSEEDELDAIKVFKSLLKISDEAQLDNVFKLIEKMIIQCQNTSPQLKNEVLLQLVKQSNTESELASVRILQTMSVFLHIYSPDNDFLLATLNFYFKKLAENHYTQKQNEYARYVFKKIIRKLDRSTNINYMPIKYQLMALMSKRKISVPVYLPVGNSMLAKVESYETFADIKTRIMDEFGINTKRLLPDYFNFFEILNFDNEELEESPIQENLIVWDTITYWEKAKDKYKDNGIVPPSFFLMLKLKYAYECHFSDEESVELMYHQLYFDYFIGRIRLPVEKMGAMAACVKFLKFPKLPQDDIKGCYPAWAFKSFQQNQLVELMVANVDRIKNEKYSETEVKFKFLMLGEESPLCMSFSVGTEQNIKVFMKQKFIYLVEKNEIVEEIPVKKITKYAEDEEKFIFSVRGNGQTSQNKIIYTEHASTCCSFLSTLPELVKRKTSIGSEKVLNF